MKPFSFLVGVVWGFLAFANLVALAGKERAVAFINRLNWTASPWPALLALWLLLGAVWLYREQKNH